jgi:predicted nucleotidyltransferase
MSETKAIADLQDIRGVVRQIVEGYHPEKVILFGSYADGRPTEDSDVDLLVIVRTEERPIRLAARISATIDHPFPLDIVVRTPEDLQALFERGGSFANDVLTNGLVLHEA